MTDVLFYHMTQAKLEEALPGLLERSLSRGWRAVVQVSTYERAAWLDDVLWAWKDVSFLPHGAERADDKDNAARGAQHPIWITTADDNPNSAQIRFLVDGTSHDDLAGYERAIYMFDGHDSEAVNKARERWRAEKAAGHAITYWLQDDEGRWVEKK